MARLCSYQPFLAKNSDMVMPNPSQIRSIVSTDNCPPRRSLFFRVE